MKKSVIKAALLGMCLASLTLAGCKKVQVFEKTEELEKKELSDKELQQNLFYVKTGTKFTSVYMPQTYNLSGATKKLVQSRVVFFNDDEFMMPDHYEGELLAYASQTSVMDNVVLERFEDMGYSIGIAGGKIDPNDGYYHFSVKDNTIPGSEADKLFHTTESDEIRLVSIGDVPIANVIDEGSGIIEGLKEGSQYVLEFYSGTYYYRSAFTADTHMMRPFEVYNYGSDKMTDTTHGYMCFNTPSNLKSGYYMVNGQGLFKYHAYEKGKKVENEEMNDSYYSDKEEVIATYTQQYNINVPDATKDMIVRVKYGEITEVTQQDMTIEATITSPSGMVYEFSKDTQNKVLKIELAEAEAGKWVVDITPSSLEVGNIEIVGGEIYEETTPYEQEFEFTEDVSYAQFYLTLTGDMDSEIYGVIIGEDGITYSLFVRQYKDADGNTRRWMHCEVPYLKAGKYTAKINYYQSKNGISEVYYRQYEENNEVYEIPEQ